MRIHLISPTHYLRDGSLHKTTRYWTSGVTLPYLKALTPPSNQVTFTDELMADVDLARVEREADVIGLTAMGPQIRPAYDPADDFLEYRLPDTAPAPRRLRFLHDNPIAGAEEAKELFRRLIPCRMQWVSHATINWARDPELLDLVARSGARVLSIGFESLSEESLASVAKSFNRPSRFKEDIEKLRARGIQVIALIMVGLDGDTPETFAATLRWLEENKIAFLKLFTPAPYPGTKFHADMLAAGRLLDGDWGHYDYGSPVVRPLHMTAEQMLDGFRYVYAGFYSVRSMLRRFVPPPRKNLLETLAMVIANAKVNGYLRRNPTAWGTIS